ncbi:MAG: contractile injection system tape measure protein [Rhizomicrobium sp.]
MTHRIGRQSLDIDMDSEDAALALQPRLGDINRRRFLPAIERVLDDFAAPGLHIRLDRIDLDLGDVPLDDFEEEAGRRLAAALREAIEKALRNVADDDAEDAAARPPALAELDRLEVFLVSGTLPFGAPAQGFAADAAVLALIESEPAALAQMLRRHAHLRHVLERLVLQLSDDTLMRLLEMLEPEHAALMLAYMLDLRAGFRADPPLPLTETAFGELLWILTLSYELNDPGTRFNRKTYVRVLLEGISQSERIAYGALLRALGRSLDVTARRHAVTSSLPAIVGDLLADLSRTEERQRPAAPPDHEPFDAAARQAAFERWRATQQGAATVSGATGAADIATQRAALEHRRTLQTEADGAETTSSDATNAADRVAFERWLATQRDAAAAADADRELADAADVERWLAAPNAAGDMSAALVRSILLLARADPAGFVALLDAQGGRRGAFARLADALDDRARARLLFALGGTRAQPILAILAAIAAWHRLPPLARLDEATFLRLLWTAAWERATRPQPLDREDFLRTLIEPVARAAGHPPHALLRALRDAAARLPLLDLAEDAFGNTLPAGDAVDRIRRYLDGGRVAPSWTAAATTDAKALLRQAVADDPKAAAALLRTLANGRADAVAERLLAALPEDELAALLAGSQAAGIVAVLRRLHGDNQARARIAVVAALLETDRIDLAALRERVARTTPDPHPSDAVSRAAHPPADFRAFDLVETARHLLRFGTLPWSALLAGATTAEVLDGIAALPAPHLRALFAPTAIATANDPVAQAAELLSEETLLAVVLRLLAPAEAARFRAMVLRGHRRRDLYARALADALNGKAVSDDATTPPTPAPAPAEDEAAALKAALLALLRSPDTTVTADSKAAALLHALLAYKLDALEFLHAVAARRELREALLRRIPAPELRRTLASLPQADSLPLFGVESPPDTPAPSPPKRGTLPPALRDAIFAFLAGGPPEAAAPDAPAFATGLTTDGLVHGLLTLIDTAPDEVAPVLAAATPARRALWLRELPDAALARLSHLLEPVRHRALVGAVQALAAAWRTAHPNQAPNADRDLLWSVLFDFLAGTRSGERSVAGLTAAFLRRVQDSDGHQDAAFLETAGRLARASGQAALIAALAEAPEMQAAGTRNPPPKPHPPIRGKTTFGRDGETVRRGEPIYIANAGLILTGPFLPHLFATLKLTARNDKGRLQLRDRDAVSRAVHLLQYLVDGRSDAPEALLVLNKILCGQMPEVPVARAVELTEEERALADSLLKAMLQNWTAIRNTSVAGLRETFLQREGKLERGPDGWKLTVQRKTLDVLVDRVPWTISMVYLDWMPEAVSVTW